MNNVVRLFLIGIAVVIGIRLFRFQEKLSDSIINRVKTKDPQQIVIASAIVVALGLIVVVANNAFTKRK